MFYRFYVLQLLHPVGNNSQVVLFTCWGRVGENGSSQKKVSQQRIRQGRALILDPCRARGPPPSQAVSEFKK